MNEGSLRSFSGLDLFCSSLILITICSLFDFMFVRGGRWTFSTAAVRDVKTMKSLCTFSSCCEMKQKKKGTGNHLWLLRTESPLYSILFRGGNPLQNKPKRRCRRITGGSTHILLRCLDTDFCHLIA